MHGCQCVAELYAEQTRHAPGGMQVIERARLGQSASTCATKLHRLCGCRAALTYTPLAKALLVTLPQGVPLLHAGVLRVLKVLPTRREWQLHRRLGALRVRPSDLILTFEWPP
jgi:hypothetical protein